MVSYAWKLINGNANLPVADGVACLRMSNGNIFWHGGIYTATKSTLYKAHDSDPGNVTLHATLPHDGRHTHLMLEGPWDGRAYMIGGDAWSGFYQPEIMSVDANGDDFRVDATNLPGLDCQHFFAFCKDDWFYYGGGTRKASISGTSDFKIDLHRWNPVDGHQIVSTAIPIGRRGLYSNTLPEVNGKHLFIGGGSYEDTSWTRAHRDDIAAILPDDTFKIVNARLSPTLAKRVWANQLVWDDKLWLMLGHNADLGAGANGDLTDVYYSEDEGASFISGPSFTGTKRHAASAVVIPEGPNAGILVANGSHTFWSSGTAKQMHLLWKDIWTYSQQPNGTNAFPASMITLIDKEMDLPNSGTVEKIGVYFNNPKTVNFKIAKQNAANNFDILESHSFSHPGGGWADITLPAAFSVPATGTYRVGVSGFIGSEAFAFGSYDRAQGSGDAVGAGVSITARVDGAVCMRWA